MLRASAAQVRALVPFAKELTAELFADGSPREEAMRVAAANLASCYEGLSSGGDGDLMRRCSINFAAQWLALERAFDSGFFRVKPKLHLFLELCSEGGRPATCWTYRHEDFGGSCARMSRRRGGLLNPTATSKSLITRFRIKQPMVRVV